MRIALLALAIVGCHRHDDAGATDDSALDDSAPVDDINADPEVHTYLPDSFDDAAPSRVIFLGDSITAGYGNTEDSLAYTALLQHNDADAWPGYDDEDLDSLYPDLSEVIDVSRGGATTSSLVRTQLGQVEDQLSMPAAGPSLVVMTIAGNDMQELIFNEDETDAKLAEVLDNLTETMAFFQDPDRFPDGTRVYIANVYEPSDGVGQADSCFYSLDLNGVLSALLENNQNTRALAEELGFAWVDMYGHFLGHGYYSEDETNPYYDAEDPSLWFASDCIHPNDRGHHEVRRLFMAAIRGEPLALEE